MSIETIRAYYDGFNAGDLDAMLDCLSDDFVHDANEGARRDGKAAFAAFCTHMNRCYKETLTDMVIMVSEDGTRAAAEFLVNGAYLETDAGLPEARGQTYVLPAGGFFSLEGSKITRVTTYYNLQDWIKQVS
ncbi:ketosteroid isomerase-related protein [Shimia abyssi]|uniref:Steroid delta-isomerase-like uncharacterized protein n=1 Tax=Shimia abyssi TaxID=1662395 RepID=A0A2P8F7V6_9RHOB|nr:ketosteroid isomerase-related protein [Shimia abyssi]PSL17806.1 steroid delta-isomerase-like uncharacterized protein [Shimia abyssi]